ncbi:MAG: sigma-70 family RNA polymerase sigma factor [Planctomycetes bacterium]|nr:sigma-70 family RNA polymerase sigma factor [Planctomycetota bacterium]
MHEFVKLVAAHQNRLYSYIMSLVRAPADADDILQETNVVLWDKRDEALAADSFTAWSYAVARTQVMAFHRDHKRDRHVFDAELLKLVCDEAVEVSSHLSERRDALETCLGRLDPDAHALIKLRYETQHTLREVALRVGKSTAATTQALYRVRLALLECIEAANRTQDPA